MAKIEKIFGLVLIGVGGALLCLEYLVLTGIGALGGWIADSVGATGGAHLGITLLAYVPVIGLILLILVGAGMAFVRGAVLLRE